MAEFIINFVPQILFLLLHSILNFWKRVRVAEGARLESVCMGNCTVSSNLTVSANKKTSANCRTFFYVKSVELIQAFSAQHAARNNDTLYFRSSFIYLRNFCITHQSFYMVFFYIAVTTVNLYSFSRNTHRHFRCK